MVQVSDDVSPDGSGPDGFDAPDMDLVAALSELGRIRLAEANLEDVLNQVAVLAKATIPAVAEASVTLLAEGGAATAAFTGDLALALDERQYAAGDGPCVDAARDGDGVNLIVDMAKEVRWPRFTAAAVAAGVRSTLSVGIPVGDVLAGGLNLYSRDAAAFDEKAVLLAGTFSGYAAIAIANMHLYQRTSGLARQLTEAMRSRAVIEQAKGVLMVQQHVTADEAFALIARASQTGNRKVREIAEAIVVGASRS